jgi:hypothetical protein
MPPGRPSDFTQEIAAKICAEMADGNSLRTICRSADMPAASTVYLWLIAHKDFSEQYTRACEDRAHAMAEEALEIADDGERDYGQKDDEGVPIFNSEHVQRSRLRVDTRKWFASKLAPKKYGDKVTQEHMGPDGGPVQTVTEIRRTIVRPGS